MPYLGRKIIHFNSLQKLMTSYNKSLAALKLKKNVFISLNVFHKLLPSVPHIVKSANVTITTRSLLSFGDLFKTLNYTENYNG